MTDSSEKTSARPTLRTISKMTGFAVATVSRALKDAPDIGVETKARVRQVAKEIGYRPNRAGVRLRTGKTNVVALVLSAEDHVMNHTAQLIYSISDTLKGSPYHLVVMPFAPTDPPMTPIEYIVETGSADGVIFNQVQPNDPRAAHLLENNIPFATHGQTGLGERHPSYDFDNAAYACIAVDRLIELGRKHLYLVPPPLDQNYAQNMVAGFQEQIARRGIRGTVSELIRNDSPVALIEQQMTSVMRHEDRPDGLIFASSSSTMAGVAAAESLGLEIGRDFDVVSKDALTFLTLFRKEIVVIQEDVSKAGRYLAKALIDVIEGRDALSKNVLERPSVTRITDK